MKRFIAAACLITLICGCMAACKTNTNDAAENSDTTVNSKTDENITRMPNNGEVTDGNGIIGDSDDRVYENGNKNNKNNNNNNHNNNNNNNNNGGNLISDTVSDVGDVVSNTVSDVGDVVSNTVSNAADIVSGTVSETDRTVSDTVSDMHR